MKNLFLVCIFFCLFVQNNCLAKLADDHAILEKSAELTVGKNYFIENKGQWSNEVLFVAQINGMDAWITKTGVIYDFYQIEKEVQSEETHKLRKGHRVAYTLKKVTQK